MKDWENIRIIPCVDRAGAPVSVIEQSRADRVRRTLHVEAQDVRTRRYVLGNGARVKPIDQVRFRLAGTEEIIARR